MKMTLGSTDSSLAIATFCWLPPDSDETGIVDAGHAHAEPLRRARCACAVLGPAVEQAERAGHACSRSSAEMLAAIDRSRKTPEPLRSSDR